MLGCLFQSLPLLQLFVTGVEGREHAVAERSGSIPCAEQVPYSLGLLTGPYL